MKNKIPTMHLFIGNSFEHCDLVKEPDDQGTGLREQTSGHSSLLSVLQHCVMSAFNPLVFFIWRGKRLLKAAS